MGEARKTSGDAPALSDLEIKLGDLTSLLSDLSGKATGALEARDFAALDKALSDYLQLRATLRRGCTRH
jgi:hypothetical protein